jgi:hypothetical protein
MAKMIPGSNCGLDSDNKGVCMNNVRPQDREYATVLFGGANEHLEWVLDKASRDGYYIQQVVFYPDSKFQGQVILWKHRVTV